MYELRALSPPVPNPVRRLETWRGCARMARKSVAFSRHFPKQPSRQMKHWPPFLSSRAFQQARSPKPHSSRSLQPLASSQALRLHTSCRLSEKDLPKVHFSSHTYQDQISKHSRQQLAFRPRLPATHRLARLCACAPREGTHQACP